ncbi:Gfo/Idh/MocA family oxidoreductase [Streptomyces sp. Je 1-79]|uniref:Gfo/Idh/MocA family protein n=1 Tax=Streptomyces sp. Je 1-79 TaxID=2943847 RepID=UPI0021A909C3|nr:Gfo/Idh/MocA family oxidoreductase [Streptomyces sp. Je 1-79]MCT4356203.1 Gfo/Idh/MocA family oxidoreductase [Streptomyces sp. Je 1-79]
MRFGVLGCADIARRRVLPALGRLPGARVTVVASRSRERAAQTARDHGARPVTGYREVLDAEDVDAVYVPLPAALHDRWVEAALLAGKHVLAEKPLTTDLLRTRALYELAESRGLVLRENVMFVHHPQHAEVARLVADGRIGELRSFHAAFAVPRRPEGDIRLRPELGGGALWDVGVYPVRAAVRFLGGDLDVAGAVLARRPGEEVDTSGAVLLRSGQGVAAQLTFGLDDAYRAEYELRGSRGRLTLTHAFTTPAGHVPVLRVEGPDGVQDMALPAADQVERSLAAMVRAVRDRDCAPDAGSLHQARLLAEVVEYLEKKPGDPSFNALSS